MKQAPLSSIMSTNVVVANDTHKLSQVIDLFSNFRVHHLPMVDDNNKLIGIISSNDLMKIFTNDKYNSLMNDLEVLDRHVKLSEIMTPAPRALSPESTVGDALDIFAEKKFLALPITRNNEVVGIISIKDVVDFLSAAAQ